MKDFSLEKIKKSNRPFFIAEIGINHNGSVEIAKKIIDIAKTCGADAVKFQKRTPEICVPMGVRSSIRETPWGDITYFEYREKIEFGEKEYKEIYEYCKRKRILWSASAWDIPSIDFLEKFDVPFHKVPSPQLTNKELLEKFKKTRKPVLLSTGMSTEKEIEKSIKLFGANYPLAILHCNSGYPAKADELNLLYISKLKKRFPNYIIGYSGHEEGISASLVAATLGAEIIERHVTVDRAIWGTDQAASIEFSGLRRLVRDLHRLPIWFGDGIKRVTPTEEKVKSKLRNVNTL